MTKRKEQLTRAKRRAGLQPANNVARRLGPGPLTECFADCRKIWRKYTKFYGGDWCSEEIGTAFWKIISTRREEGLLPQDNLLSAEDPRFSEGGQQLSPVRALRQLLLQLWRQTQRRQGLALVKQP